MVRKMHDDDDDVAGGMVALGTGRRPDPDPTLRTMQLVDKAINGLMAQIKPRFDGIETRFEAMDKANALADANYNRVPTLLQTSIQNLRELMEQQITTTFARLNGSLEKEIGETGARFTGFDSLLEERFKSVQTQFTLLKQATEQLDSANKTAISAALQAQKESAGETQKSSQAAIAKSETSTSEAIRALTTTFNAAITGATDRINDLKGRLDRGEGKSNVSDPALTETLRTIAVSMSNQRDVIQSLTSRSDRNEGHQGARKDMTGYILAGATAIVAIIIFFAQRGHV